MFTFKKSLSSLNPVPTLVFLVTLVDQAFTGIIRAVLFFFRKTVRFSSFHIRIRLGKIFYDDGKRLFRMCRGWL